MDLGLVELRQKRLQMLFDDCQQQVISQVIGPFGLSVAMFEDRNGGNVTTVHNFEREPDAIDGSNSYIAEKDHGHYEESRSKYEREKFKQISKKKKDELKSAGVDGYTGKAVAAADLEADHVTSLKVIHNTRKNHLAFETGDDYDRLSGVANADENLVATHRDVNNPKRAKDIIDFANEEVDGTTNRDSLGLDDQLMLAAKGRSEKHLESTANHAILKKQAGELLQTGGKQAALMGLRQSLGLLLTELVNGLFNEFKVLIKAGVQAGKTLFEEIKERLQRVIASVVKKIPDAASQAFQGGVSGFMSNLITFLINNFLSTAKRFVTIIREGLIGLVKAFKMIIFPPKNMTSSEALQAGLKVLTGVIVTSVGFLLQESVATFLKTLPFLIPVADVVSGVLVGIMTGLLSAFLAYQLDNLFERYRYAYDEKLLDAIVTDAKLTDRFASDLVTQAEASLAAIARYADSIKSYQRTGEVLAAAGLASQATAYSLNQTVASTKAQVEDTKKMITYLDETQSMLDDFFKEK